MITPLRRREAPRLAGSSTACRSRDACASLLAQAVEDALAPFAARVTRVPVTHADVQAMVRGRRLTGA